MSLKMLNESSFMKIRRTTLWRSNLKKHLNYSHLTTLFAQKTKKKSRSFFSSWMMKFHWNAVNQNAHIFFFWIAFHSERFFLPRQGFWYILYRIFVSLSSEISRCTLYAVAYICIKRANHTILIHIPHWHQNNLNIRQHLSH